MYPRRYPVWDDPEIEEWREDYLDDYSRLCFPLAAIGTVGLIGALANCRPRFGCSPRFGCFPSGCFPSGCFPTRCYPYRSCTPTYICHPRRI